MLDTLRGQRARSSASTVETAACDAAELPFADERFDLVLGHAVLHHLPDLERAFAEFSRVLRPGGTLFFAGEPSRQGDRIAARAQARRVRAAPLWRARAARAAPRRHLQRPRATATTTTTRSRRMVDVHAFVPADLERLAAGAGFDDVRVRGEELLANWFGWFNRTLEASAEPERHPDAVDPVRLPRLPAAAGVDRRAARAAPARRSSSTT